MLVKDVSTFVNEKQNEGIVTGQVNMIDSMYDNSSEEAHRPDSDESIYDSSDDDDDERISKILHRRKQMNERMKLLKKKVRVIISSYVKFIKNQKFLNHYFLLLLNVIIKKMLKAKNLDIKVLNLLQMLEKVIILQVQQKL